MRFDHDGVRFQYPDNWSLTQEDNPSGWTAALQSPGTAFLLFTLDRDTPEAELMVETALEAMRAEYPDLEVDPIVTNVAGQPTCGHDMRFFSLDLTNTCCTRSFYAAGGTILLSHMRSAISAAAGEWDYVLITPAANIVMSAGQIPVMGSVTWL
jgi:hypothetical protein